MTAARDTPARALLVTALVAFGCATMVTAAVHFLRPLQASYADSETAAQLLFAAGLTEDPTTLAPRDAAALMRRLEARTWDLASQNYRDDVDPWSLLGDMERARRAGNAPGSAGEGDNVDAARFRPVFLTRRDGALERLVLPIEGKGMWSTIYGYVSLRADLATIDALVVRGHQETPGIGDRIENPQWLSQWQGKRPFAADSSAQLRLRRDPRAAATDADIDAISGASVTVTGLVDLVNRWLGAEGYGPFLARLASEQGTRS